MTRRTWAIVGITAFLLVDIALAAWAISTTRATPPEHAAPVPTFTNFPTARPAPTATPTPVAPIAQAPPRLLVAVSATEAYRASLGSCTGPAAVLEKTTNGGATWVPLPSVQYNFHTVLALSDATDTRLTAVAGVGAGCTIGAFQSFTGGQFWQQYPADLPSAVYIDPAGAGTIHTGAGAEPSPCPAALQVARGASSTAVLCVGTVAVRADGAAWETTPIPGILALTPSVSGYTLAVAGVPGCAGVSIQSMTVGAAPTQKGCATAITDPTALTLSQQANNLWLWSGNTVAISADAGATW